MASLISRCLSVVVGIAYLMAAVFSGPPEGVVLVGLYLVLPLACIWFGEEIGAFKGVMRGHLVTSASPGCLVAAGGWLLLLLPVVLGFFWRFSSRGP